MKLRERFDGLKAKELSYTKDGLVVRGETIPCENNRLAFIDALREFENEETNVFDTFSSGTRIQLDTVIEEDVKIGQNCVIGGFGFGYEPDTEGKLHRMPHLGNVVIERGCIIHNLVNIDRAVLNSTIIGAGSILDSLVHIAHNVTIGKNCAIVSGAVIGGSCVIGDGTFIGMNASIRNGIKIGSNCVIGAGAVVVKDIPDNTVVKGNPATKHVK